MLTTDRLPESNADAVALNLVHNAIVDDINTPGEPIAELLESMVAIARNIGGDRRSATADWQDALSRLDPTEASDLGDRQLTHCGETGRRPGCCREWQSICTSCWTNNVESQALGWG